MSTPLVYGQHGEVLGIDYRQSPLGTPEARVPGRVPVRFLLPGDGVQTGGQTVTVLRVRSRGVDGLTVITRAQGGCEVAFEMGPFDMVDVVSVGAFTPAGVA